MSLFDLFKRKKKEEKKVKEQVLPLKVEVKEKVKKPKKISGLSYRILKEPHITEKATDLTKKNQYIFKIWPRANKTEVRKAIENLYGVDVISVKVVKIPAKQRRLGRVKGWRKGYKKAIVKIKEGQKIEVLSR